jgi:hypothetical protein
MDAAGRKTLETTLRKELLDLALNREIPVRESFNRDYPTGRFRVSDGCCRLPSGIELMAYHIFYSLKEACFYIDLREAPSTRMTFHSMPLVEFEELVGCGQVAIIG